MSTNLSITKTNAVGTVTAGSTTIYTITVNNNGPNSADGAVVTDPIAAGLNCTAVSCSAGGGATCPASPTISGLQAGLAVPVFPASSSLVFLVDCGVTATGF